LAPAKEKLLNSKEILGISQVGGKKWKKNNDLEGESKRIAYPDAQSPVVLKYALECAGDE
jgi:hypothetical protein